MTVAGEITDERLAEIASAANHLTAHSPHPRITVAEAAKLVTELQHRREAEVGLSYAQIIAIVDDCSERMKKAGESHRMLAKWISEGIHAASPSSPAWPGDNYELYESVHNTAIAAYELHVPKDYRYSATALRHAVDAAIRSALGEHP